MILRRLGNKSQIAGEIQKYFPQHSIYIEPFFGAGGMFFNKPKVKTNIVNDVDGDVFNLFQVVSNRYTELQECFFSMPIHSDLLEYWNKNQETDEIKKALRFLLISNFTFLGKGNTLALGISRTGTRERKIEIGKKINDVNKMLFDVQFANYDFRKFLTSISFDDRGGKGETANSLIYADPPYLNTDDNYSHSFKEQDAADLFDCLIETGCKFAYSEFDHPFILEQAEKRGLNIIVIGERQNLKNRRTEILVTNYKKPMSLFDGL
jgi:DNA adenine methylase